MTRAAKGARFFYAEEEAATYNIAVDLTQPYYRLLHSTIVELLAYYFRGRRVKRPKGAVLDLGCGTGVEALGVAAAFPSISIVAVDVSQPMLDICAGEFQRLYAAEWDSRCKPVQMDLLSRNATAATFLKAMPGHAQGRGYLAAITAFTFHHFSAGDKTRLYRAVFESLAPGGLFLNGDLFAYHSRALTEAVFQHTEKWIERQFTDPAAEFAHRVELLASRAEELKTKWLRHVRLENRPTPMEGYGWAADSRRWAKAGQGDVVALRRAGFAEVGCPFRYFQAGILWARK